MFFYSYMMSKRRSCARRYWGIAGGPVLSVWLALDDSLKENGALQVIPGTTSPLSSWLLSKLMPSLCGPDVFPFKRRVPVGSHSSGLLPHRQAARPGNLLSVNQEIPGELVNAEEAVLCPLLAGQMSVSSCFEDYFEV